MAKKQIGLVREPETGEIRQEWGTVTPNALRIADADEIIEALSVDYAGSFNLFYLLRKHYWTAEGAEFNDVAEFLRDAYKRVRAINDALAVRIVELGGIPPNTPPTIQDYAEVHLEAEDLYTLRASLEGDLDGCATLVASLRAHIRLADERGDSGTAQRLRDHLSPIEEIAHEIEHFLEDDALVRSEVRD